MPFRAIKDGEIVVPANIQNGVPVSCRSCGAKMYARDGENRARHFYHVNGDVGEVCPSTSKGESATHARCVALAVEALQKEFASEDVQCAAEVEIEVSEGQSGFEIRRVDAIAEFNNGHDRFGKGLIIEVQHKNHSKKIRLTSHDYLTAGYSVVWLSSEQFGEEELDFSIIEATLEADDGWGLAVEEFNPKLLWNCESYLHTEEHNWQTVPEYVSPSGEEYEICVSRPCALRRQYDEDAGRYVYDPEGITSFSNDASIHAYKNVFVKSRTPGPSNVFDRLEQRYEDAVLEKALAHRPEVGKCTGWLGVHEWGRPESLWDGASPVELRSCKHCSAHIFIDTRGYPDQHTTIIFDRAPDPDWDLLSLNSNPRKCGHRSHDQGLFIGDCPDCGVSLP